MSKASADRMYQRDYKTMLKYKKLPNGKFIVNTQHSYGSVRPVDLVSRDPDILREHETKEHVLAFEKECFQEKERLMKAKEDWSMYRTIPRTRLTISQDQKALHDNLVNEMRDNTDSLHERHDEAEEAAEIRHKENLAKGDKDARKGERSASGLLSKISFLYICRSGGRSDRVVSSCLEATKSHLMCANQKVPRGVQQCTRR